MTWRSCSETSAGTDGSPDSHRCDRTRLFDPVPRVRCIRQVAFSPVRMLISQSLFAVGAESVEVKERPGRKKGSTTLRPSPPSSILGFRAHRQLGERFESRDLRHRVMSGRASIRAILQLVVLSAQTFITASGPI